MRDKQLTETELRQKYNVYLLQLFCCDIDEAIDSEFVSYEEFKRRLKNDTSRKTF